MQSIYTFRKWHSNTEQDSILHWHAAIGAWWSAAGYRKRMEAFRRMEERLIESLRTI